METPLLNTNNYNQPKPFKAGGKQLGIYRNLPFLRETTITTIQNKNANSI